MTEHGWRILTPDGIWITERDFLWPDLPRDLRIAELLYTSRGGQRGMLSGYDGYGFQRYSVMFLQGSRHVPHAGTQIIGVHGDSVTIMDVPEPAGETRRSDVSFDKLTYDRSLLRAGVESDRFLVTTR